MSRNQATGGTSSAGTGAGGQAGEGALGGGAGSATEPATTCGTLANQPQDPIVEICAAGERCCTCGCGLDNQQCSQEPACAAAAAGPRCGTETCREGYMCCNAICGVCAKSEEECGAVPGRCQALGLDPSFQRCSDVLPTGAASQPIGPLDALLLKLQGRWLLCTRDASGDGKDTLDGLDVTPDGRFFMLERHGNDFSRSDTPATRGTVSVPGSVNQMGELDLKLEQGGTVSVLLFLTADPPGMWILRGSGNRQLVGGRYLIDPTTSLDQLK